MVIAACSLVALSTLLLAQLLPAPWGIGNLWLSITLMLPCLTVLFFSVRMARRCLKRAYLIFSPVGVEIFPWKKPEQNLDVVMWAEINHMEVKNEYLYLHFNPQKTAGKVISLKPILKRQHALIQRIVEERA